MISSGIQLDFVPVEAPLQRAHPRHTQLVTEMRRLLTQKYGQEQAEAMLQCDRPPRASFSNSVSCSMHADFFLQSTQQLREWGVLKTPHELGSADADILVVAGWHVDVNRDGKERLIYDGRCVCCANGAW